MTGKKILTCLLAFCMLAGAAGCGQRAADETDKTDKTASGGAGEAALEAEAAEGARILTDGAGREVEVPETVESIVCLNVGALRYTCYLQAQDLVVGVEDYEKEQSISRGYNYVNYELFADLPIVGNNGSHYAEEIITADPDVIVLASHDASEADNLQDTTGIPVVVVPGSDQMLDENAYETIRLMGELYGKEERAQELAAYLDSVKADLEGRTAGVAEEDKPTAYVGGVSYKGAHGFEGTEAQYGPFAAIHARNLADETGQNGPFDIDPEQVLAWDPDVIFLDYATTGDGELSGVQLIETMVKSGKKLSELAQIMRVYPQVLINVKVTPEGKRLFATLRDQILMTV